MKNKQIIALTALLTAISAVSLPAMAQHSIEPGQPIVGSIHVREAVLESQLTNDFNAGLINPLELANMRRDLRCDQMQGRKLSHALSRIDGNRRGENCRQAGCVPRHADGERSRQGGRLPAPPTL